MYVDLQNLAEKRAMLHRSQSADSRRFPQYRDKGKGHRHMANILLPVVGMAIRQAARVETAEGVMRDEERPAMVHAQ